MRVFQNLISYVAATALLLTSSPAAAEANGSSGAHSSSSIQSSTFKPPQVFKNTNLVRNINLDKGYARETVNVVVENVDKAPQSEYYLPFPADVVGRVGNFEVKDRNNENLPPFKSEVVEYDPYGSIQFYKITFPEPLAPAKQVTLAVSYVVLDVLAPLPASIMQTDKQYLNYEFSAYAASAYATSKQRTKLKLSSTDIPDFTVVPRTASSENTEDPVRSGATLTYGAFSDVPAGAHEPVSVRFDGTKPINHVTLLERDVEVSHWGGNLATEERYLLTNRAASLKTNFDRIAWAATAYYNPPTSALRELTVPLRPGSANAYFIDDIGNVSTSNWRRSAKESRLELRPRYPVFGRWNYKFRIGWDQDLRAALRKLKDGDAYALRVPFLEGPRNREGIEYERVQLRVILPEGATNVRYETRVPLLAANESLHRTFMDTLGRTSLTLTAVNLVDDAAERDLVVTYDYPFAAGLRKPLTIAAGVFAVFAAAYAVGRVDVSIGRKV